jgi:hypothetical protein
VTLDCLVELFDQGASPEEIAAEYDSVALADVYAVLTYYLRHQDDVKAYLANSSNPGPQSGNGATGTGPPRGQRVGCPPRPRVP